MASSPSALVRLVNELCAAESQGRNSGIYAGKSGYHNSYNNHVRGVSGGSPRDYSVTDYAADKVKYNRDYGSALDWSFDDARLHGDFKTIAVYSRRLIEAMKRRDSRLFYRGEPVIREMQGQTDTDRAVEGYSLARGYALTTSDLTHLWHIHMSFFRKFCNNWEAIVGVRDVLLARDPAAPTVGATPSTERYVRYPGPAWFASMPTSPIITAMGQRLVAQGCGRYKEGPGPACGQADVDSYEAWQAKIKVDVGWPPGKESWDALRVPNPNYDPEDDMPTADEVAQAVLTKDGIIRIKSGPEATTAENTWSLSTHITNLRKQTELILAQDRASAAAIDALAKVIADGAGVDPAELAAQVKAAAQAGAEEALKGVLSVDVDVDTNPRGVPARTAPSPDTCPTHD